ncbi:MAG: hypothetical protein IJH94_03645 [Clostridia bacterium]|nr:hypothetical protein [Clostridia bacterium]
MKRMIATVAICAILLSLCGLNVSAAAVTVSAGNVSCDAGGSVSIPITLSGNTGFSNLGIEVEYDSSALTLKKVAAGSTGATYTAAQSITANPYNMGWDSTSNNTFNGTLATLEFDVSNAASGSYTIRISYYKGRDGSYEDGSDVNYDENFAPLDITYENGSVSVSGGSEPMPTDEPEPSGAFIKAGAVSGAAGGTVAVPITLMNNMGFASLGIEVGYNSSVMILKNVVVGQTGATYTGAQSITANPYNMGWDSTSNNTFNGTLATLEFEIAADAASGSYPITVSYYKGRNGNYEDGSDVNYDESFAPLNLSYVGGYVTVSGGAASGKSISVGDVLNDDVLSFEASLKSDESITGVAIAAVYNASGKLIAVKQYDAAAEVPFSFSDIQNAATVKVFWWESMNGMTPQAHIKKITL